MTGTDPASELLVGAQLSGAEPSTEQNCPSHSCWVLPGTYSGGTNLPSLSITDAQSPLTTAFTAATLRGFSQDPVTPGMMQM